MQLQTLTFMFWCSLLFGQQCWANSGATGFASGISAEEMDFKLERFLKTFLERTDKIEESLNSKIEQVQESFNQRIEEVQAGLTEMRTRDDSVQAELFAYKESLKLDFDSIKAELMMVKEKDYVSKAEW